MFKRQLLSGRGASCGADLGAGKTLHCSAWLAFLLLLAINPYNWQQGANCEPSQVDSRSQQANELSQDSYGLGSGSDDLNSYGRPGGAYVNSKRARKMSAFMPMRGRKDGRELLGADSLRPLRQLGQSHYRRQPQQQHTFLMPVSIFQPQLEGPREATNYNELSAGRPLLESEPMSDDPRLVGLAEVSEAVGNGSPVGANKVPRQFVNQLELINGEQSRGSLSKGASSSNNNRMAATSADLIDNKFRRAFHPMRGKRFEDSSSMAGEAVSANVGVDLWPSVSQQEEFE